MNTLVHPPMGHGHYFSYFLTNSHSLLPSSHQVCLVIQPSFPTNCMKVLVTTLTNVVECHWQTTHFTELASTAWAIVLCSQTHRCSENALIMIIDSLVQQWLVRWTHVQNDDNGT